MNSLKVYKFSDLYEMSSGISSKPEQAGHGSPFISFKTVFNNAFLPKVLKDKMDVSDNEKLIYSVRKGDVFLTRTSESLDELAMSCVADNDYDNATFSGFLKRLRPKQIDVTYHRYMAFYLRSKLFRKTMTNNAIMTLRASFNEQIFSYLDLILPDFKEQKKIGDFLYAINQKIEVNNKINEELEAMAKTLYDYWFVQFDFPNEKNKPYKSSGGKMVYNEVLKREIPEGWEDCTLGDISNLIRGVSYNKQDIQSEIKEDTIKILRATNITKNIIDLNDPVLVSNSFVKEEQILRPYDILITMSSGSIDHIGKNGFYFFDEQVAFGAFCAKIQTDEIFRYYVYSFMQSSVFSTIIKNECLGTNINNLNGSMVKGFKLVKPSKYILESFNFLIDPYFKKIRVNLLQNQELAQLRDWLLPMLMNGQVKVE
jgi:type I restriction enzyme S subunit